MISQTNQLDEKIRSAFLDKAVLITGGMGFIGSNLAQACQTLGAKVTTYDSLDANCAGNQQNLAGMEHRIDNIHADIRDTATLRKAAKDKDFVFHCAAYTSHRSSMSHPSENVDVNCKGVIDVLEAVRTVCPEAKFVHVGTSTQVGRMKHEEIDEDHPEFPRDIYSANKTVGEKYTLIYEQAHSLRASVVRLANNYGPRAHIRTPAFGFVNYFIGLGLREAPITIYGDGSQLRNLSFVEDSVRALMAAAVSEQAKGEVFFAVADQQISVADIATAIAGQFGGEVQSVEWPEESKAIEVGDAKISNRKIKEVLGWEPTWTLEAGLKSTKDYYHTCLKSYL